MNVDFNQMFQKQYESNKSDRDQFLNDQIKELGLEDRKDKIINLISGLHMLILQQNSIVFQQYHNQIKEYIDEHLK